MSLFIKSENWVNAKVQLPEEGQLCAIFFPIGVHHAIEKGGVDKATGPVALAYYRKNEGWVYADVPRKLSRNVWSLIEDGLYWRPFSINFFKGRNNDQRENKQTSKEC